jgi:hypothetical protein
MNVKIYFVFACFAIMVFSFAFLIQQLFGGHSMQIVGLTYMFLGISQGLLMYVARRIGK